MPYDLLEPGTSNFKTNAFKHENGAIQCIHIKVGRSKEELLCH